MKILSQLLDEFIPGNYELIVVDDDSPDRTWEVAQSLTQDYPQLRVMRRQQERGLSSAVIRGWQAARSGVFVDIAVLYLLSDPTTLAWPLTRSKILAGEIAILNNFFWNDAWTFADVSMKQQQWHQRLKRFLKFNIICLAGLVLNVLVLNLVFNFIIPNRYIANLIAIAIATSWNFWVNLKLSWRVTDVK